MAKASRAKKPPASDNPTKAGERLTTAAIVTSPQVLAAAGIGSWSKAASGVSYAQLMAMRAETIEATTALDALERMARDGRGPALSQKSVHTHAAHYGIGTTRDDFCAAIVALDKATRGKECS